MAVLSVNNQRYTVDLPGDTPLLWVLRDHLHLVGTKYGCGMALCGACTVLVDGVATRSCTLPISAVKSGAEVTTIEGLKTKEGKAVQAAWEKLHRSRELFEADSVGQMADYPRRAADGDTRRA